jgi:hypothetical protein
VTVAAGAGVIRKRGGSLQVQVFAGRDPLTGRKRWLSRQVDGQTKAAWREAKKVEAQLLEQLDRGEQRGSRTRTVAELVERWLEWRQQVRPISPVTVANYRGAIDRYILPNLGRAMIHEVDAATLDTLYARGPGPPVASAATAGSASAHNPAKLATPPAADRAEVAPPDPELVAHERATGTRLHARDVAAAAGISERRAYELLRAVRAEEQQP